MLWGCNWTGVRSKFLCGGGVVDGVMDGEEGNSERCLKWGRGSLGNLSKNILK